MSSEEHRKLFVAMANNTSRRPQSVFSYCCGTSHFRRSRVDALPFRWHPYERPPGDYAGQGAGAARALPERAQGAGLGAGVVVVPGLKQAIDSLRRFARCLSMK